MVERFGWFFHVLGLGLLFRKVRLPERSVERVREAADHGGVVYVVPTRSVFDILALNRVLRAHGLPLAVWAEGFVSFPWQPVVRAWRGVFRRLQALFAGGPADDPVRSGWLARTAARGDAVLVCLDERQPLWGTWWRRPPDPLAALAEAQEAAEHPMVAVPLMVVWDRGPETTGLRRFFLGARERPALPWRLVLMVREGDPFVHVGEPIDLGVLAGRIEPQRRAAALRKVLKRALRRESKLVRGPRLLPHRTMKRLVLDNPPMRELARDEAARTGESVDRIERRLSRMYDRVAARFSWLVIRTLHLFLRPLWTRVYSGVDAREEDLERLRTAMREGAPVLVPCHKSHFDYLLLSWVCYHHDLIVPHVVAGMNLAIWPVSLVLRGAGGFFIKRTFAGDRLFPAVFGRYLRELLRQEYPVEFFIEGGRTRSGKLLPPKLGVLSMVLDAAALRPATREVTLLPIALAYEQVAEEGAYARELGGEEKKPESVGQLVKARSVLSRRFGRVYLRVGTPVRCSTLVDADGDRPGWADRAEEERRATVRRVGEQLVHRIGEVAVVLPTSLVAMALLAHHRRGILHADLRARIDRFRALLARRDALEAASLKHPDEAFTQALDRFVRDGRVEAHAHEGRRLWAVQPDERITLEFYKNQVLHLIAAAGLATCAIRARPDGPFVRADLQDDFDHLRALWHREFIWDPDRTAAEVLEEGLEDLLAHGALRREGDTLVVDDPARIGEVYALFRPLLEAYVLVLGSASRLPADRDSLVQALQGDEAALLAAGRITRQESLSKVTLNNAVAALLRDETAARAEDDTLSLDADAVARHLSRVGPMVGAADRGTP